MPNLAQATVKTADRQPSVTTDWLTEKFFEAYCYAAARLARVLP